MRTSNTSRDVCLLTYRGVLAVCLALSFARLAYAIDPNRLMSQYVHDRWGAEQGFPRGPVYAIAQTPDGYLWFGMEEGLIRFDGVNFLKVRDDSKSFNVTSVLGLMADNDGNLWLRMERSNLVRYRNGVFENPPIAGPDQRFGITEMSRTDAGDLLVSLPQGGVVSYRQGKFDILASGELPRTPILSMVQTTGGDIWVGTRDAGLFRLNGRRADAITKGIPDPKINCLLLDGKETLWVGTDTGIARWNGTELTAPAIPEPLNRFQALAMVKDRDGNIWIGTDSKLLRLNSQGLTAFADNAPGHAITSVFEDREGSLWIGSTDGIERLRDSAFVSYSPAEGLPTDGSNPVFVDSDNRTWFPPIEGGLWWMKDGRHGQVTEAGLNRDVVYSIAGRKGELWLGRRHGGLTQLRFEPGGFTSATYTKADGLAQNSVFAVHQCRDGTVWAGNLSGGVSELRNGKFKTYTSEDGLASNTIFSILEGADGTMWFATPAGLSAFSNGKWRTFTAQDGLPSEKVNCLFEDSKDTLWAGTAAGLAYQASQGFQLANGMPGSLRDRIFGLAEDRFGSLWVSTANHVLRVRREALLRETLSEGDIGEYGLGDGLRGVEGVKRHRSVVTDQLGRIWFSMNLGISVVDPARITGASAPVIVHVQSIMADGSAIDLRGPAHIPASRQRVVIGYAGLGLAVPERVRFRYTLEGFDHGWSEPVASREAVYTNLSPGPYRFRVIASNPDGIWNSTEASVRFQIEPAFWQTWWFRLSVLLACMLAILAIYRFRLHQLTRQLNLGFEERLAERTRIAQELHDTLLQDFLSVSMQLHVAVADIKEDSAVKPVLGRILPLMSRVIDESRKAVRGLRSPYDNSFNLEQAFSRFRQESGIGAGIDFRVIVEGSERQLHPVLRDEVYRIGREALLNAFRHSHARNIEIEIEYASSRLRVMVRDNGCGIDPQVIAAGSEGHAGLPGMRERAERIGGQLHIWTSAKGGTEIELSVPGQIAYQGRGSHGIWRRFFMRRPASVVTRQDAGTLEEK
ncbi:MAG: two-component regulator propeller domain-containing protein [Bryobacteraceae bacterium]